MAGSQMQPYSTLNVKKEDGVVWITFDNPPVNLLSLEMIQEIDALSHELARDTQSRVAVFQSANPEFFIAHADVDLIRRLPPTDLRPLELNIYVAALERIRALPMASIGKIELLPEVAEASFCCPSICDLQQSAQQNWVSPKSLWAFSHQVAARKTYLEYFAAEPRGCPGCHDFTAEEADRYGYINRALAGSTERFCRPTGSASPHSPVPLSQRPRDRLSRRHGHGNRRAFRGATPA